MADSSEVQVWIDGKAVQCVAALQKIAMLADTESQVHIDTFRAYYEMGDTPTGWRIAEKMREIANDTIGCLPLVDDVQLSQESKKDRLLLKQAVRDIEIMLERVLDRSNENARKEAAGINFKTVEHFTRTIEAADAYIRCLRQMIYASEQSVIDEAFKNANAFGAKWHQLRRQCDIPPLD